MSGERDPRTEEHERRPGVPPHQPFEEGRPDGGSRVDEGSEESFQASDPPASGGPAATGGQAP